MVALFSSVNFRKELDDFRNWGRSEISGLTYQEVRYGPMIENLPKHEVDVKGAASYSKISFPKQNK